MKTTFVNQCRLKKCKTMDQTRNMIVQSIFYYFPSQFDVCLRCFNLFYIYLLLIVNCLSILVTPFDALIVQFPLEKEKEYKFDINFIVLVN